MRWLQASLFFFFFSFFIFLGSCSYYIGTRSSILKNKTKILRLSQRPISGALSLGPRIGLLSRFDGILFLALKNLVFSVIRLIIFSNQFLDTEEISGNTIKILFKEKSSNVLLLHKKAPFRECQIHYTWDYTLKSYNHQCMNDNNDHGHIPLNI